MKFKSLAIVALGLICSTVAFSQEKVDSLDVHEQRISNLEDGVIQLKKLKISGYVQAQMQSSQIDSSFSKTNDMKVGSAMFGPEKVIGGNYNRFGIRRGRLKATYSDFGCTGVLELNILETPIGTSAGGTANGTTGVSVKTASVSALDPWLNILTLTGGVFDRPFGYEVGYSSSKLESPERSRIIQTLFPDENDLGVMFSLQAPKGNPWNVLKLDGGLFAGNSIRQDYKSQKDFIGHLSYSDGTSTMKWGLGASMYAGFIYQTSRYVYKMNNGAFARDSSALVVDPASTTTPKANLNLNTNNFANRTYYGFDGQFSLASVAGLTQIRAEYIFGTQPGTAGSSASPNGYEPTTITVGADTYIRNFNGGYVHFVQDIADTKHSITVKYDWYNPNTDINSSAIGTALTADQIAANAKTPNTSKPYMAASKTDMSYSTIGIGYIYRMNNNVKLTVYYDMVSNGKTMLKKYMADLTDNVLTVRMQYKF